MPEKQKKDLMFFFIVIVAVNLAIGFSDGLFSNYFKEVYSVNGFQRGLIEFPRELHGVIVFFLISAVSFLGDITIAIIAEALAAFALRSRRSRSPRSSRERSPSASSKTGTARASRSAASPLTFDGFVRIRRATRSTR